MLAGTKEAKLNEVWGLLCKEGGTLVFERPFNTWEVRSVEDSYSGVKGEKSLTLLKSIS